MLTTLASAHTDIHRGSAGEVSRHTQAGLQAADASDVASHRHTALLPDDHWRHLFSVHRGTNNTPAPSP